MGKRDSGNRSPVEYSLSMFCPIINQNVILTITELIDGWPVRTQWKKVSKCNCNKVCNPKDPYSFPRACPAKNIEISKEG